MNPYLIDFIKLAKNSNIFNKIMMTTNGLLLKNSESELWQLLDGIEISVYPTNNRLIHSNMCYFMDLSVEHNTELSFYPRTEFNHILFSTKIPKDLIKRIYLKCYYKNYCHTLFKKRLYKCSPSAFGHHYLSQFTSQAIFSNSNDYLSIRNARDLKSELIDFFGSPTPLGVCHFCAGSSGKKFQNEQISNKKIPKNEFNYNKMELYE